MVIKESTDLSKLFFTSDLHFNHFNIISFAKRPFNTENEMNEEIIKRFNNKVPEDGVTYFLGDLYVSTKNPELLSSWIRRLNGKKHLILGNHDYFERDFYLDYCGFESVSQYLEIVVEKNIIVMSHYPMMSWNYIHRGAWMLYGHVHGTFNRVEDLIRKKIYPINPWVGSKTVDVGIDNNVNLEPFSYKEIKIIMDKL